MHPALLGLVAVPFLLGGSKNDTKRSKPNQEAADRRRRRNRNRRRSSAAQQQQPQPQVAASRAARSPFLKRRYMLLSADQSQGRISSTWWPERGKALADKLIASDEGYTRGQIAALLVQREFPHLNWSSETNVPGIDQILAQVDKQLGQYLDSTHVAPEHSQETAPQTTVPSGTEAVISPRHPDAVPSSGAPPEAPSEAEINAQLQSIADAKPARRGKRGGAKGNKSQTDAAITDDTEERPDPAAGE